MSEKYGSFKDLSQGKKPITAEEAWIMLKELGLLGQEFVPGATSIRKLMKGDVKGAGSELNDWIPGGKAVQNLAEGKDQDWAKNALDLAIIGKPLSKRRLFLIPYYCKLSLFREAFPSYLTGRCGIPL